MATENYHTNYSAKSPNPCGKAFNRNGKLPWLEREYVKGLRSVSFWCRLGYSTIGCGIIADTEENQRVMYVEGLMLAAHNSCRRTPSSPYRLAVRPCIFGSKLATRLK